MNKICIKCHIKKEESEFYTSKKGKLGLQSRCKKCSSYYGKIWRLKHKERLAKKLKIYREKNKKRIAKQRIKYREQNKEKIDKYNHKHYLRYKNRKRILYLRTRYNLSLNEYQKLLKKQNGVCAICKEKEISIFKGTIRMLAVDHDHRTGKVRGLLCGHCNHGLGNFKDNIKLFKNAIKYLNRS